MKNLNNKGIFITIEGPDGCGKTTQANLLVNYLNKKGRNVILTREPGGCSIGEEIRNILLKPRAARSNLNPKTELFLFAAARAQHVQEVILPAILSGRIVIASRFIDATLAYQGYGRGLPFDMIRQINNFATDNLKPDLTIILDINSQKGIARARNVNEETPAGEIDRIEGESLDFHQRVRQGYIDMAKFEKERFVIINSDRPIDVISHDIINCIEKRFKI